MPSLFLSDPVLCRTTRGGTQEVVVSGQVTWEVKLEMVIASDMRELRCWWKNVGKSCLFEFKKEMSYKRGKAEPQP